MNVLLNMLGYQVSLESGVTWKHFHNMYTIISVWTQLMKLHAFGRTTERLCLEKHMHAGSLIGGEMVSNPA